ncbi:Copper resistance protein D [Escherichia coli]|nr:copper resistance protein D [Escherichia coli]SQO89737.1 Copper resistance protein D [Escherichia coli]
MTSLKTSIKTITYLSDTGCLEIQGASLLMLLLAAANRFHLGPRLEVMVREGNYDRSVALMRNSILTEFVVAIIILGAVAWLRMLAPSQVS